MTSGNAVLINQVVVDIHILPAAAVFIKCKQNARHS